MNDFFLLKRGLGNVSPEPKEHTLHPWVNPNPDCVCVCCFYVRGWRFEFRERTKHFPMTFATGASGM